MGARLDADGAHKNAALFGDTKVLQSSPESTRPQSRRLTVFNDIFIVLIYVIYIYIFNYILFFFNGAVHNCKAGPAHRSARALREGAPRGGRVSPQ